MQNSRAVFGFAWMLLSGAGSADTLEYVIGADLSFVRAQQQQGIVWRDRHGVEKPVLQLFKEHGYGWIRLRLFHTPSAHADQMPNDLAYTLALAQEAKSRGLKFLLCYHYSDSWADPGKQYKPAAWNGTSLSELQDSVYRYTRSTIEAFRRAGVMPDMVQIGNEIRPGMLWNNSGTTGGEGRIVNNDFADLATLLKAGVRGVDSGRGDLPMPLIMMHIDRGGSWTTTKWWFDGIIGQGVPFDVIGQSYYPEWHGTLDDLRNTFVNMGNTYDKDAILVETAHYGTQSGIPLTEEGQVRFLRAVDSIVKRTPNGRGKGVMWWEPTGSPGGGSSTRNFFTRDGSVHTAKPVLEAFASPATGIRAGPSKTPPGETVGLPSPRFRVDGRRGRPLAGDDAGEPTPSFPATR